MSCDGERQWSASRTWGNEKMIDAILNATFSYEIGPDFVNHFVSFTLIIL
jgi:hypothetical protein